MILNSRHEIDHTLEIPIFDCRHMRIHPFGIDVLDLLYVWYIVGALKLYQLAPCGSIPEYRSPEMLSSDEQDSVDPGADQRLAQWKIVLSKLLMNV